MEQGFNHPIGKKIMLLFQRDHMLPLEPGEKIVWGDLAAAATKIHVRIHEKGSHKDAWENQGNSMLFDEVERIRFGPQEHEKQAKDKDAIEGNSEHPRRKKRSQ